MKTAPAQRDRSITATIIISIVIALIFLSAYFRIADAIKDRSIGRMEEGVNTVINEVSNKFKRDSEILNSAAEVIMSADNYDVEAMREVIQNVSPLLQTMKIRVLTPDNQVITAKGDVVGGEASGLSYEKEAPLGEHVSNRELSSDGQYVLRHFVPIIQNGNTAALLYGVTILGELPAKLNVDNLYNASAKIYIVDTHNGDFLVDTWHNTLGNLSEYNSTNPERETKGAKSWDEYVEDIMSLGTGYVIYKTPNTSGWQYMYYAPANINEWSIIVDVPESEAFDSVFRARRIFIIAGVFLCVAIVIYYLWVRKNAEKTIQTTVEHALLEEKLRKAEAAEKAKTMFLSNMSHDIRTPMNAIIGFTTLAETNIDNKERVQDYLKKILSSSNHLLSLINDILDMSRIESGRLNIEEKPVSISDIFRDMRNIIQTQMATKQLNFFMDTVDVIDEDIYCDKLHINQILLNLLSNAIKFTPAGGSVSLTIKQKYGAPKGYGSYEIRVKDTGLGMSEEFAKHVFEPFERERTSTVSGIQGTGLGMAITKNIVDAMGGTIECITEQGKGTEFIINLEFRLQGEKKQVEVIQELAGLRALVVDDDFNTCDSVTKMLIQLGMRAEWTLRGKEAVLHASHAGDVGDPFIAYIIDWSLPDLNGIEVARQIRSIAPKDVPIIVLTAYDWTAIEEEARKAGVTAFVNKPIFLSELRETLISVIGGAKAEEASPIPKNTDELIGKRLLLVEDNELNREIAEEILIEGGIKVDTAEDGTEAVRKVCASEPGYYDLILMDIQMPVMNGYEATKRIRSLENKELANIPIVAMTANAFDEDVKAAEAAGMNGHLAKPINIEKLFEVLKYIIGGKDDKK